MVMEKNIKKIIFQLKILLSKLWNIKKIIVTESCKTLATIYQTYMSGYRLKYAIKESKAQVLYIYDEKEMKCVKESAKLFQKMHLDCTLYEAKGYNHGYLSAYLPLEWMEVVNHILIRQ